jgi:hypothetical protein
MSKAASQDAVAQVSIEHKYNPEYPVLQCVAVHFTCPHLRIGQPSAKMGTERDWIMDFLDLHDHYGPASCTAEIRRRYEARAALLRSEGKELEG